MDSLITKICNKCNIEKPIDDFYSQKRGKYGKRSQCKECSKIYDASRSSIRNQKSKDRYQQNKEEILKKYNEYYYKNKEKVSQRSKIYYANNKKAINIRNNKWHDENEEKHKLLNKRWRTKNLEKARESTRNWSKKNRDKTKINQTKYKNTHKEKISQANKIRRQKNIDKYKKYQKEYRNNNKDKFNARSRHRRKTDPQYAIKDRLRARLGEFLRYHDIRKSQTTKELIGCNYEELINYLESLFYPNKDGTMMSRADLCTPKTNIDHVIPCWMFDLTKPEEQRKCFHYSNLQPLWKEDHDIKTRKDTQGYHTWKRSGLPLEIYLDPIKREKAEDPYNIWL